MMRCMPGIIFVCLIGSALADDPVDQAHTPPQSPFRPLRVETRGPVQYEGRASIRQMFGAAAETLSGIGDPHAATAAPAAPAADPIEQIKQLSGLRDAGAITTEEFEEKKAELLGQI